MLWIRSHHNTLKYLIRVPTQHQPQNVSPSKIRHSICAYICNFNSTRFIMLKSLYYEADIYHNVHRTGLGPFNKSLLSCFCSSVHRLHLIVMIGICWECNEKENFLSSIQPSAAWYHTFTTTSYTYTKEAHLDIYW